MIRKMPKNLTRNEASGCVMARITRNGELHSKNFSLVEYGTWKKAQDAAQEWLDEIKQDLPDPVTSRDRMTARNASGVVGVALRTSTKQFESGPHTSYSWHAFWPGHRSGTRWGIAKYGDEGAFARAYLSRKLETDDRDEVEQAFPNFKRTAEYRNILKSKQLEVN